MDRMLTGRNSPCPCGSGKKYKKCCLGITKAVAFINYKGQEAVYPAEEARLAADKLMLWLIEVDNKRSISVKNGLKILQKLYGLYENVQRYFSPYYSCARGCGYCCYPYVGVSLIEGELVKEYINGNFSREIQELFIKKIYEHKNEYVPLQEVGSKGKDAERLQLEYFAKQIPCPFLSEKEDCLIYPVRPLACRALAVFSDPLECKYDRVKDHFVPFGINDYTVNTVLKLSRKVFGSLATVKHLPAWFVDGGEGRQA